MRKKSSLFEERTLSMSDYLNKPDTYDSPTVIEAARREIARRAWTTQDGHDPATHLQAGRKDLTGYLADLDQRHLISGTIFNYLRILIDVELEKVQEEAEGDNASLERSVGKSLWKVL
jgi:hypothetical protein